MGVRIVALAPPGLEAAFALGLHDEVVGVGDACAAIPGAEGKPRVGALQAPDARAVRDLKPELVLACRVAGLDLGRGLAQLRATGVEVDLAAPADAGAVLHELLKLGLRTGRVAEASAAIDALRGRLEAAVDGVPPGAEVPCYLEVWPRPSVTPGGQHWMHDVLRLAGGRSVVPSDDAWERIVTPEELVAAAPARTLAAWPLPASNPPGAAGAAAAVHRVPDPLLAWPGTRLDVLATWMVGALHGP